MDLLVRACLVAFFAMPITSAASDCDCKRRVGLCQAHAHYDGARIVFTSQTHECSRISFSLRDEDAAITIGHGQGSVAFPAPGAKAGAVPVSACYVCDVAATR